MIQQRPGDVLEIQYESGWYYFVVVTKVFRFGGNIVYAFHGNGARNVDFSASTEKAGFNICTDLLLPKKEDAVERIGKVTEPEEYLVSNYVKSCHERRPGYKAKEWWLSTISEPDKPAKRMKYLSAKQRLAMDSGVFSFDLAVNKIKESYTPDKNQFISRWAGLFGVFS